MRRRTFIAGSVGAVGALAGCSTLGGDGGDDADPTDPVESFVQGYATNDTNATQGAVHPDGPLAGDLPRSVDDRQLELANATVVSEANGTAVVEANVSVRGSAVQWHEPREFEVREVDGDWRIWSMATGPEVALEEFFGALEAGRTDDATDRLHFESPTREWLDATVVEHASPTLESASLAAFWDDEATIDATFTEDVGEGSSERSQQIELRRSEEGWQVWSLRFGPVVPVHDYVRALNENDADLLEQAAHPDSDLGEVDDSTLQLIDEISMEEPSVESIEAGEATVETSLEFTALGEQQRSQVRFFLRPHEGEWLIHDTETIE